MSKVTVYGYCYGPQCPIITEYETVPLKSLSLGCQPNQPEAEVEESHAALVLPSS